MPLPGAAGQLESRILTLERLLALVTDRVTALEAWGVVALPTPLTNSAWEGGDGAAKTSANNGVVDLRAVFGAPAGIRGVFAAFGGYSSTAGAKSMLGPSASYAWVVQSICDGSNYDIRSCFCPCDGNGNVYWSMDPGYTIRVILRIYGYLL